MGYCNNCGAEFNGRQTFCSQCGTVQTKQPDRPEIAEGKKVEVPKKLGIKTKIILFATVILLFAVIGTHIYLSAQATPSAVIDRFEKAVISNDSKTVAAMVNDGQKRVEISAKEASDYIKYLTKDQDFNEITSGLREQGYKLLSFDKMDPISDDSDNDLIEVTQGPKEWIFYNQYKLRFYPIEVKVSSDLENTSFYLEDKEIKKANKNNEFVSLGYFMPGAHKVKGNHKGKYSSFEKEYPVDFSTASNNVVEIPFEMGAGYIQMYSNDYDAKLFVNGKDTGKTIGEMYTIGPVALDGSVTAYATSKEGNKTIKSKSVKISDDSQIDLSFENIEVEEELNEDYGTDSFTSGTDEYEKSYYQEDFELFFEDFFTIGTTAINMRDFSLAENFYVSGGKAYQESSDYISHLEEKGITEEFLGAEVIQYDPAPEGYYVQTRDSFRIFYNDGTSKDKTYHSKFYLKSTGDGLKVDTLLSVKEL